MKRTYIVMVVAVSLLICLVFVGAANQEKSQRYLDEQESIRDAVAGSMETLISLGKYESSDGSNRTLSIEEKQRYIQEYNTKVDRYYSRDHAAYALYKSWNEEYLTSESIQAEENCIDAGVSDVRLLSIDFDSQYREAEVEAYVTCWNKWVTMDKDSYGVACPVSRTYVKLRLVFEDGFWKLIENIEFIPSDNAYDRQAVEQEYKRMVPGMEEKPINRHESDEIEESIDLNQRIMSTKYATYQEAVEAAKSLDVVKGNYYAYYENSILQD